MIVRLPIAYLLIAGACLALHNAVLIACDFMGLPLWLAVLASFAVVASVGYVLHALLTFRQPLSLRKFVKYCLGMSLNIPLAFVSTWFLRDVAGLPMVVAAPVSSALMLLINYFLGRWAIKSPEVKANAV